MRNIAPRNPEKIEVLKEIVNDLIDSNTSALMWSPDHGYTLKFPDWPTNKRMPAEMVILGACFLRAQDYEFQKDMLDWYRENQN